MMKASLVAIPHQSAFADDCLVENRFVGPDITSAGPKAGALQRVMRRLNDG